MTLLFLNLGGGEIFIILLVVLLFESEVRNAANDAPAAKAPSTTTPPAPTPEEPKKIQE